MKSSFHRARSFSKIFPNFISESSERKNRHNHNRFTAAVLFNTPANPREADDAIPAASLKNFRIRGTSLFTSRYIIAFYD